MFHICAWLQSLWPDHKLFNTPSPTPVLPGMSPCTDAAQVQKHPMPIMHMCQQDVHRWCCRPIAFYQTHYLLTTPIADMAAGDHHDSSTPSDSSMCAWITKSASNLNETTYTHATSGPTRSFAHKPVQVQVR